MTVNLKIVLYFCIILKIKILFFVKVINQAFKFSLAAKQCYTCQDCLEPFDPLGLRYFFAFNFIKLKSK